jgi:hypothetical protein
LLILVAVIDIIEVEEPVITPLEDATGNIAVPLSVNVLPLRFKFPFV